MSKPEIKDVLQEMPNQGFFNDWKTPADVVKKLQARGFNVKGKKIGMICRMLTKMCQDPSTGLEREEIPKDERTDKEKWRYKKVG